MTTKKKTTLSTRLDAALVKEAKRIAKKTDRSLNNYIQFALRNQVEVDKRKV